MILQIVILFILNYILQAYMPKFKKIKEKELNLEEEIMLTIWYFLKMKK